MSIQSCAALVLVAVLALVRFRSARARARVRQARAFAAAIDHGSSLVQEIMSCALRNRQRCGRGWSVEIAH